MQGVWTGVSRGHIRRRKSPCRGDGDWKRARRIEKSGGLTPLKGQTHRGKQDLICSTTHSTRQGPPMVARQFSFRYYLQLPPSCCQRAADILHPATVRCSMGTAKCGPACLVVWGLGEKNPWLTDWASILYPFIRMIAESVTRANLMDSFESPLV